MMTLTAALAVAQKPTPNLKDYTDGKYSPTSKGSDLRSLPDGEHYTAMDKLGTAIVRYEYRTGRVVDTLFNTRTARECDFKNFEGYEISPNGHHIIVWRESDEIYRHSQRFKAYDYDVRRKLIKPLNESGQKIMLPTFSPDGRMCAYVVDNNIWIKKFDYDTEVQVTRDGATNRIINGSTDWVYEEEFAMTRMMTWSADSRFLAFVRFDESEVPEYSMQMYGEKTYYPSYHKYKYPNTGDRNSTVSVHAYNIETKDTKTIPVPLDADGYIPRIEFTTVPDQLAVMTFNRHQSLFSMYFANPASGVCKLILKDENTRYINPEWVRTLRFNKNGFLYVSERDGYAHIYQYAPTGVEQRQVTRGNWDVTRLIGLDEATNTVYFEAADESPLRRSVCRVDAKGVKTNLSKLPGTNAATFSKNYAYYVLRHSSATTPTIATLHETKSGKELRTLQDNAELRERLAKLSYGPKEFFTVRTADGVELNAWMVKPADFNAKKKYPVLMTQYSGPNSQSVLDRFEFGWEECLAAHGVITVCVDGRGTGARGEEFRKCTYLKMGDLESKDQVAAAKALAKQFPFVDASRMAIWGWSFGGYNTLMSMSVGEGTFKVGIAVAPPTDWHYYNTIYTERYMRTPKENANYELVNPITRADQLHGNLLLIHGTADDNVHYRNCAQMSEALVQADKPFEMQVYTNRNHSIYGGATRTHLFKRIFNFLERNLK